MQNQHQARGSPLGTGGAVVNRTPAVQGPRSQEAELGVGRCLSPCGPSAEPGGLFPIRTEGGAGGCQLLPGLFQWLLLLTGPLPETGKSGALGGGTRL